MQDSSHYNAGVVAIYDRLAAPLQFAAPARDLVTGLGLSPGRRVLDIGTGTGAALIRAAACVGASGVAVGVDASMEMLRALRHKGAHPVVLAQASSLPFPDDCFDAVLASFVLSHFKDYGQTLADMVRVLRPKGRVAATTWGATPNPVAHAWKTVAAGFVEAEELQAAFRQVIPWDQWFSRPTNLRRAMEEAELVGVEGTFLCRRLTAEQLDIFRLRLADVFQSEFGETVEYIRDVYVGMGTKPAA